MNEFSRQLQALSLAADQHAREQHGHPIGITDPAALDLVDRILDRERSIGNPELIEPLTLCYGAWWGEYINHHSGGQWVGVNEPTPPRVSLRGLVFSPLDAVRRRLMDESAPSLHSLARDLDRSPFDVIEPEIVSNRLAWDDKAKDPRFTQTGQLPGNREEALEAVDPWLRAEGPLEKCRLLCLAAGGGTHGPLHAMAGAKVTVVDFSPQQLLRDREVAQEFGLALELIDASMHDLSVLEDATFDAIIHPVSLCYVRDVHAVYAEIGRLLKPGGIYISQQKQPASLQASGLRPEIGYVMIHPADEGRCLPPSPEEIWFRESGMTEFIHSLDTLLGSLCRSGFVIEDIREPPRGDAWALPGSPEHRARYLPPYLKIKARWR